jgi:hypothetical protein
MEAVRRIGNLLSEEAARFWTGDEWTMDVTDSDGLLPFFATIHGDRRGRYPGFEARGSAFLNGLSKSGDSGRRISGRMSAFEMLPA